ncbi:hypothetical protein ACVMGC_002703 [Bradyrhizobium barranii subsp. barranii]
MPDNISHERRRFVGRAAMALAATQLALSTTATAKPAKSAAVVKPGANTLVRVPETDRRRPPQRRLCRGGSRGWPARDPAAWLAL